VSETKRQIIVAGAGGMGEELARALWDHERFPLVPVMLTGENDSRSSLLIAGTRIPLVRPDGHREALSFHPNAFVVDATKEPFADVHPANRNAALYAETSHHFVMMTVGGDRDALRSTVVDSSICAVIDVNMSSYMMFAMEMFRGASENLPGILRGFTVEIDEDHQTSKGEELSGTARKIADLLKSAGAVLSSPIRKIRDKVQPHAYHRVVIKDAGGNVVIELKTTVEGRSTYAQGALAAVEYLDEQVLQGWEGKVSDMADVWTREREV
jgi:dihydrodipicolinate reductase